MKKLALATALTVALTGSLAAQSQTRSLESILSMFKPDPNTVLYFGAGTRLCSEWTRDRANGTWSQKAQWVLGYLSAVNVRGEIELTSRVTAAGSEFNTENAFRMADLYCQEFPDHTLYDYATAYVQDVGVPVIQDDDLEW